MFGGGEGRGWVGMYHYQLIRGATSGASHCYNLAATHIGDVWEMGGKGLDGDVSLSVN